VPRLVDVLEPLPGPLRHISQGRRRDRIASALRLAEHPDGHGPVVAGGTLAFHPPFRRVLLQKDEAALDRRPGLWRGGGLLRGAGGVGRPHSEGQQTERRHRPAGTRAEGHGRILLRSSGWALRGLVALWWSKAPLEPPPDHGTRDGPGHEPEGQVGEREKPADVLAGIPGSVLLQGPPPQRGGTERGAAEPAKEAAEDEHLGPQEITHR